LLAEKRIASLSPEDQQAIVRRWHELETWPDFTVALARLRGRYVCVSFTILSLSLVVDTARPAWGRSSTLQQPERNSPG